MKIVWYAFASSASLVEILPGVVVFVAAVIVTVVVVVVVVGGGGGHCLPCK